MIEFTVAGVPAPQGSKTRTKWGGVREDNPATRPWRQAVAWEATATMRPLNMQPLTGPLELQVLFVFPRPKHHYRTGRHAGMLKPSAPIYCTTKPDVDKLIRAVADGMSGIVYRDDCQLVRVRAVKCYGSPHAVVTVKHAPEETNP